MKKIFETNKNTILMAVFIVFLGIIYFSYNMTMTWDTSEYLGLADYIGTEEMTENWIGHRGIAFPLLLKLFKPFGIENKIFMLILMFMFYIAMVITIYKIYKKLIEHEFFKSKITRWIFAIYTVIFIVLNPMLFGYYHTLLTEFVSMTITLLMCYLSWKWIDFDWKEHKKSIIIYAIIFSLLTIFLYHIKQSLVPLTLLPILTATLLSVINNFKLSDFLTKTITLLSVIIMLFSSISIWNILMKSANVLEDTEEKRVNGQLIKGVSEVKQICDEQTINDFDRSLISNKENNEIEKVLSNESKYTKFRIYKASNDKYLVYFSEGKYSFKEDVGFYFKILFNSPVDIVKSYYKNYWRIIFTDKAQQIWLGRENFEIPYNMYAKRINIVDVNEDYIKYIKNYFSINETNVVSKIFNGYVYKLFKIITVFNKISLWILPITWLISVVAYIIINRKISKNTLKILQFIIILYTTSFGGIMAYILFGTTVDRYTVPMMIPTFIAHFLSLVLLTKKFIKKR